MCLVVFMRVFSSESHRSNIAVGGKEKDLIKEEGQLRRGHVRRGEGRREEEEFNRDDDDDVDVDDDDDDDDDEDDDDEGDGNNNSARCLAAVRVSYKHR